MKREKGKRSRGANEGTLTWARCCLRRSTSVLAASSSRSPFSTSFCARAIFAGNAADSYGKQSVR